MYLDAITSDYKFITFPVPRSHRRWVSLARNHGVSRMFLLEAPGDTVACKLCLLAAFTSLQCRLLVPILLPAIT